jgi:transposase InsO family protein
VRSIGGILHLEVDELVAAGLSQHSIYSARKRGTKGYTFVPDPEDARRVLLRYDDLKPQVKAMVDQVHGEAVAGKRTGLWVIHVRPAAADLEALRSHLLPDGTRLPEDVVSRYAIACAYLRMVHTTTKPQVKAWGYTSTAEWMQDVLAKVKEDGVELPGTYGAYMSKLRQWAKQGATAVISAKWGNSNSRKIGAEQSAYLIAEYAQPNKPTVVKVAMRYAVEAKAKGWPALTDNAIYRHLMQPDVKPIWTMGRHGKAEWKNDYAHTMSLRGPSFRDALWCSDGTKLNYFYQGQNGMMAKLQVYVIMDVYSEAIIGHSFSHTEDFMTQFNAAKMALKLSGHKPLQWLYDNQGGHRKAESQDFYTRASKLHFPAQPYNSKAKPVESLIGRLQQQVMRERWFFTGQNITARNINSRPNMEFIEAHRDRLPSLEEVMRFAADDVATWNSLPHPKSGVARMAMYQASVNPQAQPISFIDMVELFWHTTARQVQYRNTGLTMDIGQQRLMYEVYAPNGLPCQAFLRRWTNARFFAKYDPQDLSCVRLYIQRPDGSLSYVAQADAKRTYARAVVDLQPGERSEIDNLLALRKAQEQHARQELEELRNISGIDPETLVEIGYRGNKDAMNYAEAELQTGHHHHQEEDDEIDLVGGL